MQQKRKQEVRRLVIYFWFEQKYFIFVLRVSAVVVVVVVVTECADSRNKKSVTFCAAPSFSSHSFSPRTLGRTTRHLGRF